MKKILFILSLLIFSLEAFAIKDNTVSISNTSIKKIGGEVAVSFDMEIDGFPQNYKVTLVPILYNNKNESRTLPPVTIVGRKKNIADRRGVEYQVERRIVRRNSPRNLEYSVTVPFEQWMQVTSIAVYRFGEGCLTQFEEPGEVIAEGKLLYYDVVPFFNASALDYELTELEEYDLENPFLHPMEDYNKRYDILLKDRGKGTSTVIFKVGSHMIDLDMQDNKDVLDAIGKAFDLIENDPNAILKQIMVAGYASPEGSLAFNTALAQRRAESVKKFLQSRMKNPNDNLFEVYNGREDWDGLRNMVEKSEMEEKEEIISIIDSYTMEQEMRKAKLKQLYGGAPYKYMLENFYPTLRCAGYVQVYYEIDRRATVATAITDSQGRTTWLDPDSPRNRAVTNINKAVSHMVDHNFDKALDVMLEFKDDPRAWNNIGVCYMMKGNYDEANKYFVRAAEQGDEFAPKNLEQTGWAKSVEK